MCGHIKEDRDSCMTMLKLCQPLPDFSTGEACGRFRKDRFCGNFYLTSLGEKSQE
jgi:hypothetical protein